MSAALGGLKMASQLANTGPKTGSILAVEVEQALPDVLMVRLKTGGRIFRGVLLDTCSGVCPVGLPSTANLVNRLNEEFHVPVNDTAVVNPSEDSKTGEGAKGNNSALSYRQSYFQNMPLPSPRPLLCGKKEKTPELKPKAVSSRSRPFRLRPRQLLCSKCKSACQPVKAKRAQSSSKFNNNKSGLKKRKLADSSTEPVRKKPKTASSRTVTNGGSVQSKPATGSVTPRPTSTPDKSENRTPKKTSPAIKISYATPGKGQRLVVRIPPRTQSQTFNKGTTNFSSVKLSPKEKKRVLTVPLLQIAPSVLKSKVEPLKRPFVNGVHVPQLNNQHDKIRIVKSKGTYHSSTIPKEMTPVRTYGNTLSSTPTKLVNGSGKLGANVAVKPISLINGYIPLNRMNGKDMPNGNTKKNRLPLVNSLPHLDNSDAASDCSSHTTNSRGSGKGSKKKKTKGINNNSECEFDSDVSLASDRDTTNGHKKVPPVKLGVHKKNVTKCTLPDGRQVCIGDIIWGKIVGFPWWPGRVVQLIITRNQNGSIAAQEAQITWFASRSISYMPVSKIHPFLKEFKQRYDKKRKGLYKDAITQATEAAEALSSEVRELHTMFETPTL